MARQRFICVNRGGKVHLVDVSTLPKRERKAPAIHVDSMAPLWHPCDGQYYESKSEFRRVTREHGCEEVGGGWKNTRFHPIQNELPDEVYEDAVGEAVQMLEQGWTPPPLKNMEQWERELEGARIAEPMPDWPTS